MERYLMLRSQTDAILEQYGGLLFDLVGAPAERGPASPGQHLIDTSLNRFLDSFYAIKSHHESRALTVSLLALTKSGKSTFLNALLGEECMPSGSVPETARICRIVHDPKLSCPIMLENGDILQGSAAVRQRLHDLNSAVRERSQGSVEEEILSISAPFPALARLQEMPTTLHLLDTPGPNEAGEEGLKYQVERLLDGIGVLVYLLDCSKLKTQEEKQMFQRLKEINPQLLKRLSKRLFFLVNKKDVLHEMSEEDVCKYVAELVTGQMEDQEFQLDPQQVMLISAKTALYSRLVMTGKASQEQRTMFAKVAFGQTGYKRATDADILDAAEEMFKESGFETVEQRLLHFLYDHAGRVQLMGTVDDMTRNLTQVMNTVAACEAVLQRGMEELSLKMGEMSAQMELASQRFQDVRLCTDRVEQEVTDEIRGRLGMLKERLFLQVEAVLSEDKSVNLPPSWRRVWGYVQKMLHVARSTPTDAPRAELELQNRLADMYLSISNQVGEEVRAFWHELESATNIRQQQLFAVLNQKLQNLSGEFESVVMERLDVKLETADIRISPPSPEEYHHNLGKLFESGIAREEVTRHVETEVEDTVIERGYTVPMCKMGAYYYARPVKRTETTEIKEMKVSLSAEKVKEFFMDHVEGMVTMSIRAVRLYVRKYLTNQVEGARSALDAYCASYQAVMAAALAEGNRSEEDRLAALTRARERLQAISKLKATMEALAADMDGAKAEDAEPVGEEAPAGATVKYFSPVAKPPAIAVEGGIGLKQEDGGVDDAVLPVREEELAGAAVEYIPPGDKRQTAVVEGRAGLEQADEGQEVEDAVVAVEKEDPARAAVKNVPHATKRQTALAEGGTGLEQADEGQEVKGGATPPVDTGIMFDCSHDEESHQDAAIADGDAVVDEVKVSLAAPTTEDSAAHFSESINIEETLRDNKLTDAALNQCPSSNKGDCADEEEAVLGKAENSQSFDKAAENEADSDDGLEALLVQLDMERDRVYITGSSSDGIQGNMVFVDDTSSSSSSVNPSQPQSTVDAGATLLAEMGAALEAATADGGDESSVPSPAVVTAEVDAEILPPSFQRPADNGSGSSYDYGAAFMSAMSVPADSGTEGEEDVATDDDFVLVKS